MKKFQRYVYFGFMILLVGTFIWHIVRDLYEHDMKKFEQDVRPPVCMDMEEADKEPPVIVLA